MSSTKHENLVIISLPFYRITRALLSEMMVNTLKPHADILVVGPFVEEPQFKGCFSYPNMKFLRWEINSISNWKMKLYWASEIMRINGFWLKFKDQGLSFYLHNQHLKFGKNGEDEVVVGYKKFLTSALAWLGRYPNTWKLFRRLVGKKWFVFSELVLATKAYKEVTLIQAANWGIQDSVLAKVSQQENWRKVLIPYTTDQLYCNGYLLNQFDAFCIQGSYEYNKAKSYFKIPDNKLFFLGSTWFRHLDLLKDKVLEEGNAQSQNERHIIYAGNSPTYFPRINEFAAVDALIKMAADFPDDLKLIYRPIASDEGARAEIIERYRDADIQIQWPEASCIGLEHYQAVDHDASLRNYVSDLNVCELLIMSQLTSMALDAVYISKCPVIANFIDLDGVLKRRRYDLMELDGLPGLKVVYSVDELCKWVDAMLNNKEKFSLESMKIAEVWDVSNANFQEELLSAVFQEETYNKRKNLCNGSYITEGTV